MFIAASIMDTVPIRRQGIGNPLLGLLQSTSGPRLNTKTGFFPGASIDILL